MAKENGVCQECLILSKFINILNGKRANFGIQEITIFKESLRKSEGKSIRKRKLKDVGFVKGQNLDLYYNICDRLGDAFIAASDQDKEYWSDIISLFKKKNRILPLFANDMITKLEKAYQTLNK